MKQIIFIFLLITAFSSNAQVLPLRDQAKIIDEVLAERLNNLLPTLMQRNGIDMWVLITREYNEDPIVRTMLPATWISARRRTILVFIITHKPRNIPNRPLLVTVLAVK